jgi:DNA repair exonuclease SbcCD ATPase subunit
MAFTSDLGIDRTPQAVRIALASLLQATQAREAHEQWELQHTERQAQAKNTEDNLRATLTAHGVSPDETRDTAAAYAAYVAACQERQALANQASRREDLTNQLNAALAAAKVASATQEARARASEQIRIAAERCGVGTADEATLVSKLRAWQEARKGDLAARAERSRAWAQLQAVLGSSGSVENLAHEVERLNNVATLASVGVSDEDRVKVSLGDDAAAALNLLREEHAISLEQAAGVQGQANERAKSLLSVPEGEERLARAEASLAKVTSLGETLRQTREFLSTAQDRVHRDIAPILAKAVRDFLEQATAGRYSDVIVDPATLNVRVCGQQRQWRDARLLSHGTREQVYLLLRMALADHLSTPGERCPLILDDVTVHSDDARKEAMLTLLVQHASERQVVLFSQEAAVLNWCQANATGPTNAVRLLEAAVGT